MKQKTNFFAQPMIDLTIKDYISNLDSVNLETTNRCNMIERHPECPIAARREIFGDCTLDTKVIDRFLMELHEYGFKGRLGLHHYSESLVDPRIYDIIDRCGKLCPNAKVNIITNGKLLTVQVAQKLLNHGVYYLQITAYSFRELIRLNKIVRAMKKEFPDKLITISRRDLDGRMGIYSSRALDLDKPCKSVKNLLVITSTGELQLCCMDFLIKYRFGNLYEKSLIKILAESNYLKMAEDLIEGKRRNYDLCSRCNFNWQPFNLQDERVRSSMQNRNWVVGSLIRWWRRRFRQWRRT